MKMLDIRSVIPKFAFRVAVTVVSGGLFASAAEPELQWKMHVINDQSPYEACGAADFNGDGRVDIFCGDSWYEAPSWNQHRVRNVPASGPNPHYHEDFCDAPLDVNGDGHIDIVTCNYFGRRAGWVENPGSDPTKPWIEHEIDTPGNMETGELLDLNGDGKPDFLPNTGNVVVWYELTAQSPEVKWTKHDLGSEGAGHGVGAGDINSDGRTDIITPKGWYEQPDSANAPWTFHQEFELGAAGVLIHGRDVDGDQRTDVVWGMGHGFGLYWLKQSGSGEARVWTKQEIDGTFSQVHTLVFASLSRSGEPMLITGKRVYAHEVEPGATDGSVVYAFQFDRADGTWHRQTIFQGDPALNAPAEAKDRWALKDFPRGTAGTGLQLAVVDVDGDHDLDLVCPGKSGLYLFENVSP